VSASLAERMRSRERGEPEDSIALRVAVGAMVEWSILAVVAQGAVDGVTATVALLAAPAGYAYSYVHRRRPSLMTKIALAIGLLLALGMFLGAARGAQTFDDTRKPLAALFLWVQVLHAFDVPRRRDLGFSSVSSLILIAEAAAMSFGTGFLVFLVPWLGMAAAWMFLTLAPPPRDLVTVREVRHVSPAKHRPLASVRAVVVSGSVVLLGVMVVFLALPRLPGANVALPPFSARHQTPVEGFGGQVSNPDLAVGADGVTEFSPDAYPGFGPSMDLRARGHLSDRVAFRVRAPQALLWRGQVFDTYDGTTWTVSDQQTIAMSQTWDRSFGMPTLVDEPPGNLATQVLATVFVAERQPNVVFAPYLASEIYFPSATLATDRYASVRSPIYLEDGMVYSVMSQLPAASPDVLRAASGTWDPALVGRYLQLPSGLPGRVADLAHRITDGQRTEYAKVTAVQSWLQANTEYDLDIPPDPPGVDAVDHFLFERRQGFCEHIASAMAVLLRSVGVPARLVAGFGPGERNLFTGYWDVREADAHAWVEVLYPGVGWVPYDPTFGVPAADPGVAGRFIAPQVLQAIGRFLSGVIPEPVKRFAGAVGRSITTVATTALQAWPVALALGLLVSGVVLGIRRRTRRRALGPPPTGAARAFVELETAMRARGHPRLEPQTPSEFLDALPLIGGSRTDAELVVRTFERERFAPDPPDADEVEQALTAARRIAVTADR